MCGLLKRDSLDNPDIGFAFLPQYTEQGYALEIAAATLEHARSFLHIEKISAITDPANERSIRLLQKLGMTFERKLCQ
jgi:RimJ/RimL family protein N-acetyltransferase